MNERQTRAKQKHDLDVSTFSGTAVGREKRFHSNKGTLQKREKEGGSTTGKSAREREREREKRKYGCIEREHALLQKQYRKRKQVSV